MNLATVAVKNVRRHVLRNVLTIAGVVVAMLAFVLLRTILSAWNMGAEYAAKDRVATRHKVTFVMTLPKRYVQEVQDVPGVQATTWMNWFGAKLPGKEDQFFANMACDPKSFFRVYDEVVLPPKQKQNFLDNRRGAIVGKNLAKQFGWKVGDKVTLAGTIFPGDWEFIIEGIYTVSRKSLDQSTFFFHWDYLNEGAPAPMQEQVGWIVSRVKNAGAAAGVAKRIDTKFDVRDVQTLSMSERALNASFLGMLATVLKALDVISMVIVLIMMLILGNTVAMGVRERTREYGALRAIGFFPKHLAWLVLGEALFVGSLGGVIAVGLSIPFIDGALGPFIEGNFSSMFPYFRLQPFDAAIALALSALGAAIAAAVPAYQASKLVVADALRRVA